MNKKKVIFYRILEVAVLLLALTIFFIGILNRSAIGSQIGSEIETYGYIGLFITSFFLELIPQYVSPHIVIISAVLLNLDLINSFFLIAIGGFLGSILGFGIGKFSRNKSDLQEQIIGKKRYEKISKKINNGGKWIILLAAISPLPYIPLLWGLLDVKFKNYLIWGLLPRAIGYLLFLIAVKFFGEFVLRYVF